MEMELFGVRELTLPESKHVSGGGIFGGIAALVTVIGACIYVYNNVDDFIQGVKDGYSGEYNYEPCQC